MTRTTTSTRHLSRTKVEMSSDASPATNGCRSRACALTRVLACALVALAAVGLVPDAALAQDDAPGATGASGAPTQPAKIAIAVPRVEALSAIAERVRGYGQKNELDQIVQGLDAKLSDALFNTRKFEVRAHADLQKLLGEQSAQDSGNYDLTDPSRAKPFRLAGIPYLALVQIDDFQDQVQTANFEGIGAKATRRQIRLSAVCRIFDATRGTLLESARVTVSDLDFKNNPQYVVDQKGGDLTEAVVNVIADRMANQCAQRITDVIFPAKVLVVRDGVVTLNRGEGTAISIGEVWEAFATGEELVDPDTGEVLGSEEVGIGFVRVISVAPKFSRAEICGIDRGIAKGCILRKSTRTDCEPRPGARMWSAPVELPEEALLRGGLQDGSVAPPLPSPTRSPADGPRVPPVNEAPPAPQASQSSSPPAAAPSTATTSAAARPVAAIFVRNREKRIDDARVMQLEDELVAALDGACFTTISREDALNAVARFAEEGPNAGAARRGVDGDPIRDLDRQLSNDASALQLAQAMGADYVLVASLTALRTDRRTLTEPGRNVSTVVEAYRLDATYRILGRAEGRVVASGSAGASDSVRQTPELQVERDVIAGLVSEAAVKMADAMKKRCERAPLPAPDALPLLALEIFGTPADLAVPEIVKVAGADGSSQWTVRSGSYILEPTSFVVEIDGIVVGTTPSPIRATKGLHKLRITRPGYEPYEATVNVQPGVGPLVIPMRITDEERARWQEMARFFADLKTDAALTEAQVSVLEGYATMLRNSKISVDQKTDVKVDTDQAPVFENNSFWRSVPFAY
jgi:curli biogenesis system outer membrane secretion channel CsgG